MQIKIHLSASGPPASGKSTILYLVAKFLESKGLTCTIDDISNVMEVKGELS